MLITVQNFLWQIFIEVRSRLLLERCRFYFSCTWKWWFFDSNQFSFVCLDWMLFIFSLQDALVNWFYSLWWLWDMALMLILSFSWPGICQSAGIVISREIFGTISCSETSIMSKTQHFYRMNRKRLARREKRTKEKSSNHAQLFILIFRIYLWMMHLRL